MEKFDAKVVMEKLLKEDINLFMAVPTVYFNLLNYIRANNLDKSNSLSDILSRKIRLMVSGSAALPETVMDEWEKVTGHRLLERYGMTEALMIITNPMD